MTVELSQPAVCAAYMSNVPKEILVCQRAVFRHLSIPLNQVLIDGRSHGKWLSDHVNLAASSSDDTIIVIADIDAFPLSLSAYKHAIQSAGRGRVFGLAQVANHCRPKDLYAGPCFLAFSIATYIKLGAPDLDEGPRNDVAQRLTDAAIESGIEVELKYPTVSIVPKWPLAERGVFGIGTFYGDLEFFHLFQSRLQLGVDLFRIVADDVSNGRPLDFQQYLHIAAPLNCTAGNFSAGPPPSHWMSLARGASGFKFIQSSIGRVFTRMWGRK